MNKPDLTQIGVRNGERVKKIFPRECCTLINIYEQHDDDGDYYKIERATSILTYWWLIIKAETQSQDMRKLLIRLDGRGLFGCWKKLKHIQPNFWNEEEKEEDEEQQEEQDKESFIFLVFLCSVTTFIVIRAPTFSYVFVCFLL